MKKKKLRLYFANRRKIIFILLVLLSFPKYSAISQVVEVPVGDSIKITDIIDFESLKTQDCSVINVEYTHNDGTDFYLNVPRGTNGLPSQAGGYVIFKPTKIGIQNDAFNVTIWWNQRPYNHCVNVTHVGPISITASGISKTKSVHLPQTKNENSIRIITSVGNPFIDFISNLSQPQNTSLELYDALGRQLTLPISQLQIPSGTSSQKLEVGNLSSGCYILRMKIKDQVISKSFIITR